VTIASAACRQGRNHGMSRPGKHACALTAVIHRVLLEGFRQRITGRGLTAAIPKSDPMLLP
jgi:hypothetical protein